MLSHCLCEQDISARARRWRAGAGIWSGQREPHQGPRLRLPRKPLWAGWQEQLTVLLQPHHVRDGRGQLTPNRPPSPQFQQPVRIVGDQIPLCSSWCLRWWSQLTRRRWSSSRSSAWLSVSAPWISASHWPIYCCPANRPSKASITGVAAVYCLLLLGCHY